jgi:hypothetical protein
MSFQCRVHLPRVKRGPTLSGKKGEAVSKVAKKLDEKHVSPMSGRASHNVNSLMIDHPFSHVHDPQVDRVPRMGITALLSAVAQRCSDQPGRSPDLGGSQYCCLASQACDAVIP